MKKSYSIDLKQYRSDAGFVGKLQKLVREVVIPYQYEILNDAIPDVEKSHAFENVRLAVRKMQGEDIDPDSFYGFIFQDSDIAKWIEAASYSLVNEPNPELEKKLDEAIELYGKAQSEDGYVNSYFTVKRPDKRWTNLREAHELYCAGHMMEAAVAHHQATGKDTLLSIMKKNANGIYDHFMDKNSTAFRGFPGHPEVEQALMRLWRATGEEKYKELALHFVDQRGQDPHYFKEEEATRDWTVWGREPFLNTDYTQSTVPVREQKDAVGHAVRAVYLYTAMADLAKETGDQGLLDACNTLWNSITRKRMFVTGGIGSANQGEAFTVDYHLPNDTTYCETCASIGLMMFARQMLGIAHKGEYADVMERAFYNTVLAGMQLDGKRFFYVNPLEVVPGISGKAVTHRDVVTTRPQWYACACCPPNVARTVCRMGEYAYSADEDTFYIDLFVGGTVDTGKGLELTCETQYPHAGLIQYTITGEAQTTLAVRLPAWSKQKRLVVNGESIDLSVSAYTTENLSCKVEDGYAYITRSWEDGDVLELSLDMDPQVIYASSKIAADNGKACVQRGPLVYCAEEVDNGTILPLMIKEDAQPEEEAFNADKLGGIVPLTIAGYRVKDAETDGLYSATKPEYEETTIQLIPYFTWANRGENQMRVWMPVR